MRILTILGSPKKHGNTADVLGRFEALVAPRHEVEHINLADGALHGCLGCNACQRVADKPGCVQKDATASIIERVLAADLVVYATPLYAWSFSAQMKALLDREYCLAKVSENHTTHSLLSGKHAALLVTCSGPKEDNADLVQTAFERQMVYSQCKSVGKYVVPFRAAPQMFDGDKVEAVAQQMARDVDSLTGDSGG
jgi:multimeric flavodoxin WrbA